MIWKAIGHEIRSHQFAVEAKPEECPLAHGDIAVPFDEGFDKEWHLRGCPEIVDTA